MIVEDRPVKEKSNLLIEAQEATCILVLGMHRSGTSVLSRVLNFLGCDLPANLLGANDSNKSGHWESTVINKFNDRILESGGSSWKDWQEFNNGWYNSPKIAGFRAEAESILKEEFGNSKLFVLKDPRICLLAPFWYNVLESTGIKPLTVLCLRNPIEVSASLNKRNDSVETTYGYLLWLRYVLEAEKSSRYLPRFFINYDQLFTQWNRLVTVGQQLLGITWPRISEKSSSEINSFISVKNRHHNENMEATNYSIEQSGWIHTTYKIFTQWAMYEENPNDHIQLDKIRNVLNDTNPIFTRLISVGQTKVKQLNRLKVEFTETQDKLKATDLLFLRQHEEINKLKNEEQNLIEQFNEREIVITHLNQTLEQEHHRLKTQEEVLDSLHKDKSTLFAQLQEKLALIAETQQKFSEIQKQFNEREIVITHLNQTLEQEHHRLKTQEEVLDSLHKDKSTLFAQLQEKLELITETQQKFSEIQKQFNELKQSHQLTQTHLKTEIIEKNHYMELVRQLDRKQEEIKNENNYLIRDKERIDKDLENRNKELSENIKKQNTLIDLINKQDTKLTELNKYILDCEKELIDEKIKFEYISDTLSWKITSPFRAIAKRKHNNLPATDYLKTKLKIIRESKYFKADWYLATYKDVADKKLDPALHYLQYGAKEGRNPGPNFDTEAYNKLYPHTAATINPLIHKIILNKIDIISDTDKPIITKSATKKYNHNNPSSSFKFLKKFSLRKKRRVAILTEEKAVIAQSHLFNSDWYLKHNLDVAQNKIDPVTHYLYYGAKEMRDPGPEFNTKAYLERYKDVAQAKINPLLHYIRYGYRENRTIVPSVISLLENKLAQPNEHAEFLITQVEKEGAKTNEPTVNPSEKQVFTPPDSTSCPISFPIIPTQEISWIRQINLKENTAQSTIQFDGLILGTMPHNNFSEAKAQEFLSLIQSLVAFGRLINVEINKSLSVMYNSKIQNLSSYFDSLQEATEYSITTCIHSEIVLTDIHYTTDYDLRIRFDLPSESQETSCIIRVYQYDLTIQKTLKLSGEASLFGEGPAFVDVVLSNPFLPLLVVTTTPEGQLLQTSIIPFPSLARGGFHYGELCSMDAVTPYPLSLQKLSAKLLNEWLGINKDQCHHFALGCIEVELEQGINGGEPIFSTSIQEWLTSVMHIRLIPSNQNTRNLSKRVLSYLISKLTSLPKALEENYKAPLAMRELNAHFKLIIPANSIPSLHALTSRHLNTPEDKPDVTASFIVTDESTLKPLWMVYMPPLGNEVLNLQPANIINCFPVLVRTNNSCKEKEYEDMLKIPLAIKFQDRQYQNEANLVLPIPTGSGAAMFRGVQPATYPEQETINVLLPLCGHNGIEFSAFIESLRFQTVAHKIFIIAVINEYSDKKLVNEQLELHFSNMYLIIESQTELALNARIHFAAQHAMGKYLLVADENIILHDSRTLEILSIIANGNKTATASCILINEPQGSNKTELVEIHNTGVIATANNLRCTSLDCHNIFPLATYPVIENTTLLFMVRRDIWEQLEMFNKEPLPNDEKNRRSDIIHFCTSIISAGYSAKSELNNCSPPQEFSTSIKQQKIYNRTCVLGAIKG